MPINDGTGGFKAWSSSLLSKIKLEKVRSQGYSFQIEMNFEYGDECENKGKFLLFC